MRQCFLRYEEMRKYFPLYEEAVGHIWLCNCSTLNILIYEEKFDFLFYQCGQDAMVGPVLFGLRPLRQLLLPLFRQTWTALVVTRVISVMSHGPVQMLSSNMEQLSSLCKSKSWQLPPTPIAHKHPAPHDSSSISWHTDRVRYRSFWCLFIPQGEHWTSSLDHTFLGEKQIFMWRFYNQIIAN